MRFMAFEGTVARGFLTLAGLWHEMYGSYRDFSMRLVCIVTNVPTNRTPPTHGTAGRLP
jgi:hypothetical protein